MWMSVSRWESQWKQFSINDPVLCILVKRSFNYRGSDCNSIFIFIKSKGSYDQTPSQGKISRGRTICFFPDCRMVKTMRKKWKLGTDGVLPKQMNFRKSSKGSGGGGHFRSKKLCYRFWTCKQGLKLIIYNMIFRKWGERVKGCFEFSRKLIRFDDTICPLWRSTLS